MWNDLLKKGGKGLKHCFDKELLGSYWIIKKEFIIWIWKAVHIKLNLSMNCLPKKHLQFLIELDNTEVCEASVSWITFWKLEGLKGK